jgi:predicted metalloprotease with PDZ domain
MLVDGPVLAGEYLKVVALTASLEGPPRNSTLPPTAPPRSTLRPEVWEHYRNLVKQAGILFGAQHYTDYHFLLTLSDHVAHFGLEHHESNDSRSTSAR